MTRLWEVKHPYYATEGNYFSNGCHVDYESWRDFIEAEGDADLDMNLVYRWDWEVPDPTDYAPYGEPVPPERLLLFFVGQRIALLRSARVVVSRDDEPEIRAWLQVRADYMARLWEPLHVPAATHEPQTGTPAPEPERRMCECDAMGDEPPQLFIWRGDPEWWSCSDCDGRVRPRSPESTQIPDSEVTDV